MPNTIQKNCLNCSKLFGARIKEINRGNGKFCCFKCFAEYNGKMRPKPEPNVNCALCSKAIYKNKTKKKGSKSGLYFCCREHKDMAQKVGGIKEIMPPHYGTGALDESRVYRRLAFNTKKKICERCGYNQHEAAIIVHHKDRNRMNDSIDNLEVLCANCHAIEHWSNDLRKNA